MSKPAPAPSRPAFAPGDTKNPCAAVVAHGIEGKLRNQNTIGFVLA
jgi:hypothetical protein